MNGAPLWAARIPPSSHPLNSAFDTPANDAGALSLQAPVGVLQAAGRVPRQLAAAQRPSVRSTVQLPAFAFGSFGAQPESFPNLTRHYDRMMTRPAVQRTLEAEAAIGYNLPA